MIQPAPRPQTMRLACLLIPLSALVACSTLRPAPDSGRKAAGLPDIIGSTHARGTYHFSNEQDFLNEGGDALLAMGSRVIKLWFYNGVETPEIMYSFNSQWPKVNSLVEGAQLPYWRELFHKPFTTYILNTMAMGLPDYYWLEGITEEQMREEERQFYELARHFLTEYQHTGKTFILANHETDWHLKPLDKLTTGTLIQHLETPPQRLENAVRWFTARQNGVNRARAELGMHGVRVFHAAEVVNVVEAMKSGQPNVVNTVLPRVKFDLISYSCYDSTIYGDLQPPENLAMALDYIATQAQPSDHFGTKNVYIGEYGMPENPNSPEKVRQLNRQVVDVGLRWGCPYIVYWELYCNEANPGVTQTRTNTDCRGFWLIRPDGSKSRVYADFQQWFKQGVVK